MNIETLWNIWHKRSLNLISIFQDESESKLRKEKAYKLLSIMVQRLIKLNRINAEIHFSASEKIKFKKGGIY